MKVYPLLLSLLFFVACNHIDLVDEDNTDEDNTEIHTGGNVGEVHTVAEILSKSYMDNVVWVDGYIVGYIKGTVISKATFSNEDAVSTNLLLADTREETDIANVIPLELQKNELRDALNLSDHPENYQRRIRIRAICTTYFGVVGLRKPSQHEWISDDTPTTDLTMPIDYEATFEGEGR